MKETQKKENTGGHRKPSNNNNISNTINIQTFNYKSKYIKIGTHNVRGFNLETKQREMFDEYKHLDIDIIGITETKLSEKQGKNTLNNKKIFKSWWTGNQEKSKTGGVGIAVKTGLDKHVANVIKKLGRLISIDLNFKGSAKTRIINLYINCNEKDKQEREQLINELIKLIDEAKRKNYNLIVMGDMNADIEKYDNMERLATKGKYKIIQTLRNK